ncbi:MAG: hypothetical protein ACE1ZN_01820 [Dehalococcoidia bacterium]
MRTSVALLPCGNGVIAVAAEPAGVGRLPLQNVIQEAEQPF